MKREKICRTDQQDEAENVPEEKKAAADRRCLQVLYFLQQQAVEPDFIWKIFKTGNGDGR